jgi:hypothetical protein
VKIEFATVEKKHEETPFVVGGVYRLRRSTNTLGLLIEQSGTDHMLDLRSSTVQGGWERITPEVVVDAYEYVPDAKLVLPKEA